VAPAGQRPAAGRGGQAVQMGQAGRLSVAAPLETDPKRLCRLEGRTVNATTGEPIPRVSVTLAGGMGANAMGRSARSDNEGRFLIENVQPGTYRLMADRVGFLRQGYGTRTPGGPSAPLNLSPGQSMKDLEFRLTPQGVILGTVVNDEGDPLPRTSVVAYRLGGLGTMQQSRQQAGGLASTNDIGEYRLAGLTPGRYFVVATAQVGAGGRGTGGGFAGGPGGGRGAGGRGGPQPEAPAEDFLPTYYPSTLDPAGAVAVDIAPGQEVGGVTVVLKKGALYRVQGKIVGGSPQDLANVQVTLMPRGGGAAFFMGRASGAVGPDGAFQITRVRPGSYYLIAQRMGRQGAGIVGLVPVEVTTSDATGLMLPLTEPMPVTGAVRIEGDQKVALQRLTVSLTSIEGLPVGAPSGRVAETGAFKLDAVPADNYYVTFSGLPEGTYVKSVRMGNQEVLDKGIDLTSARGSVSLDVILSPNAGSVEGVVTGDGKPAAGSFVAILADPIRPGQPYLNKFTIADQDGRFTFTGVAPGDYKLYAWEEAQSELVRDPGLARPFEHKAVKASVGESRTEQAELKVLKPEDARR
jgi:hypothetical protein